MAALRKGLHRLVIGRGTRFDIALPRTNPENCSMPDNSGPDHAPLEPKDSLGRRDMLGVLGGAALSHWMGTTPAEHTTPLFVRDVSASPPGMPSQPPVFPRKADFAIEDGATYLNAAYTHPIPRVSVDAARIAAEKRGLMRGAIPAPSGTPTPRALFAQLINAKPTEIAHVSSTSAGENLVVRALELDHRRDGNVVTDGLHFEGALMNLNELRKRGLDVRIARPTADARIDLRDLERLIDRNTKLVEITATAMYNGFQHDLKAVADMAHANGALVYVDIVHAAGAEPLDVHASGIDFAACSSFKWLMGDFGLGFLYAREAIWDRLVRPVASYYQAAAIDQHVPPYMPAGAYEAVTYEFARSAAGFFEMGSLTGSSEVGVALLASSLTYVQALGVANIQAHRAPLIRKLQQEMPRLGYRAMTPLTSTGGIVTFAKQGLMESEVPKRLAAAKINVRLAPHWLRISPSVYNDMADIERLLGALS
ncbi:putative aminotransferase [Gemmatimonas aurantiaca T-27]|uniref:Putative aminotransferase n=1 Tax=Gemmatimonas aurantiaca (strain DSM 14586 / JCM 11422 / NBRC 100505 / T-27) TaxID=379066 RepID=C1A3R9_GEMAT|nr:putative aminotransferase [Gemmatimonas aurantiaca T-27]